MRWPPNCVKVCRLVMDDEDIHLLILTGSGEVFSVGRETKHEEPAPGLDWLAQLQVASSLAALPIPVVVALNGDALDHGLELALAGDPESGGLQRPFWADRPLPERPTLGWWHPAPAPAGGTSLGPGYDLDLQDN